MIKLDAAAVAFKLSFLPVKVNALMVKCVSEHAGARLVRQDGRGGGKYQRGGKS